MAPCRFHGSAEVVLRHRGNLLLKCLSTTRTRFRRADLPPSSAAAPRYPRMSVVAKDGCPRPTQPSRSVPTCSATFASSRLRNARDRPLPIERKEQNYGKSTQTQHRLRPWTLGRRLLLQQTHPDPSGRGT